MINIIFKSIEIIAQTISKLIILIVILVLKISSTNLKIKYCLIKVIYIHPFIYIINIFFNFFFLYNKLIMKEK